MKTVKQSFTLVEILVVIVIIGILSSFIFFTINDSVEKANIAKSKMFSESIRNNLLLNLVSEWTFDGGTGTVTAGTVLDSWGSNNAAAVGGTPQFKSETECVSGTCIEFDGVNEYINMINPIQMGTGVISLSFWLNMDSDISESWTVPVMCGACGGSHGWGTLLSSTSFRGEIYGSQNDRQIATAISSVSYKNTWNHILMLFNRDSIKIYENSVLKRDHPIDDPGTVTSVHPIVMGSYYDNAQWFYKGKLDEVMVYDNVITETAIKQNYLSGLNNLYAKGLITELEYNEKLSEL